MLPAKLRQLALTVATGRVTLPYPAEPHPPADGFRGLPTLDGETCIGCGTCASACPSRLISLTPDEGVLVFTAELSRCVYCARCAEVCPTGAMTMTSRFENATTDPRRLRIRAELVLAACPACGRPLGTTRHMVRYLAGQARLDGAGTTAASGFSGGTEALCPTCKRRAMARRLKGGRTRGL